MEDIHWSIIGIIVQITAGHHIVCPEDSENVDVEDAEAELDSSGEDLDQDGTGSDDPTPASLTNTLHYIALHCIALHYIALHYIALD